MKKVEMELPFVRWVGAGGDAGCERFADWIAETCANPAGWFQSNYSPDFSLRLDLPGRGVQSISAAARSTPGHFVRRSLTRDREAKHWLSYPAQYISNLHYSRLEFSGVMRTYLVR